MDVGCLIPQLVMGSSGQGELPLPSKADQEVL